MTDKPEPQTGEVWWVRLKHATKDGPSSVPLIGEIYQWNTEVPTKTVMVLGFREDLDACHFDFIAKIEKPTT